ncbi:thioesterase family protein [Flavobacterium sp. ASW18X]|uniref:acyl-CoA thioesterase n=1 Tax=Flavobacterium sp. ASW18X TaxID=2572595 RepID=UPI0010AE50EB|nr:thioesterase family protein [Flavobacterium sp. ASW18X]TKD65302.1 thioesterase [Flavobacterium sp. ASW18X]
MFLKDFEVRWSDVDANRHLANSAYINFMSHTRMAYLTQIGFGHKEFEQYGIGPVVFYEHMYYFKEVFPGKPIRVSLEWKGLSEDGMFFEFHHNFYDYKGRNVAHCEMMGAFIDMKKRSLTGLPKEILDVFLQEERAEDFRFLTKEDTRKFAKIPKDLA